MARLHGHRDAMMLRTTFVARGWHATGTRRARDGREMRNDKMLGEKGKFSGHVVARDLRGLRARAKTKVTIRGNACHRVPPATRGPRSGAGEGDIESLSASAQTGARSSNFCPSSPDLVFSGGER